MKNHEMEKMPAPQRRLLGLALLATALIGGTGCLTMSAIDDVRARNERNRREEERKEQERQRKEQEAKRQAAPN
ncbi:MAG: hypothetical protein HYZ45_06005 [Burkholderiales bacterium]|nr:hypothetical protein [Burkholderiales bacterium]